MLQQLVSARQFARKETGFVFTLARHIIKGTACCVFFFSGLAFVDAQSTDVSARGGYPTPQPQQAYAGYTAHPAYATPSGQAIQPEYGPQTDYAAFHLAPTVPAGPHGESTIPRIAQNEYARLPQPRVNNGASSEFRPLAAEHAPRYGEPQMQTFAATNPAAAQPLPHSYYTASPAPAFSSASPAPATQSKEESAEKKSLKAKPANPFDYIDFNGMYQAMKRSSKKAADSTKKAADSTTKWLSENFTKWELDENEDEGVLDGLLRKTPVDDHADSNPVHGILYNAVNEERAGNLAAAEFGYTRYIQIIQTLQKPNRPPRYTAQLTNAYHRLAIVYWRQGRLQAADSHFQYAVDLSRRRANTALSSDYALYLEECGKHTQGEALLRNALVHDPGNARLERLLGRSLAFQNRPVEAVRHLNEIMEPASAYQELASIYRRQGDEKAALLAESRAKSSNPAFDPSHVAEADSYRAVRSMTGVTGTADINSPARSTARQADSGALGAQGQSVPPRPPAMVGGSSSPERTAVNDPYAPWIPAAHPVAPNDAPRNAPAWVPSTEPTARQMPASRETDASTASRVYHYSNGTTGQTYHYIPTPGNVAPVSHTTQR